jgi:hypothetical protein
MRRAVVMGRRGRGSRGVWKHLARRCQGVFFKRPVLSPIRRRLGSGDVRSLHDVGWEEKTAVSNPLRNYTTLFLFQ